MNDITRRPDNHSRRNRLGILAAAAVVVALLAPPAIVLAAGALDQEQATFGSSKALIGTEETGPDVRQGQVFTAGVSGSLDQLELPVRKTGDPGVPLLVEIRALGTNGYPSNVLSSTSVAEASVPACTTAGCDDDSPSGDFSTFTFMSVSLSTPVVVAAGTQYAIVLSATGANNDIRGDMIGRTKNRYEWAGVSDEFTYSNGKGVSFRTDIGWIDTNADRAFRTYVSAYVANVEAPINADGSSNFKAKGSVPVRFSLSLGGATTCLLPPATIAVTRTDGTVTGAINEDTFTFAADSGSNFRIAGCMYSYNLNSKGLGAGTYLVEIKIGGETVGQATFDLR
jgi:hypothetical protein